jgi:hypothetical protein
MRHFGGLRARLGRLVLGGVVAPICDEFRVPYFAHIEHPEVQALAGSAISIATLQVHLAEYGKKERCGEHSVVLRSLLRLALPTAGAPNICDSITIFLVANRPAVVPGFRCRGRPQMLSLIGLWVFLTLDGGMPRYSGAYAHQCSGGAIGSACWRPVPTMIGFAVDNIQIHDWIV